MVSSPVLREALLRSGSKVGCNNYRFPMPASTSHRWCPTLKDHIPDSLVPEGVASVYEIVLNGIDETSIRDAMRAGIRAATETGAVMYIGASNFDGKLGRYRFTSTAFSGDRSVARWQWPPGNILFSGIFHRFLPIASVASMTIAGALPTPCRPEQFPSRSHVPCPATTCPACARPCISGCTAPY